MKHSLDDLIGLNIAGIGYKRLIPMIEHFGSTKHIINAGPAALETLRGIGPVLKEKISLLKTGKALKKEWSLIEKHNIKVLSVFDREYPELLKQIYDPPIILYIKGKIIPEDKNAVALVGSRKASMYGLETSRRISARLAATGVTIVSGLARGIDGAAHKAALKAYGRTLAVLGNGLSSIYPPENKRLADDIACSGAVISEFPMDTEPSSWNFPVRNRIISGLSLGIVVVEAAKKSGALITASRALEQGREVFAVPGKAGSATSMGAHNLIKNGARLTESADDVLDELNLVIKKTGSIKPGLDIEEERMYRLLSDEPEHIDIITEKSNLPVQAVSNLLLKLEVKRLAKQLPGRNYMRGL